MFSLILTIVLVVGMIAYLVSKQPDEFRVSRSATMNAPAATIFEQVNTLRNWEAWSPWKKMEPQSTGEYGGPPSGVNASFHWVGKKTGEGTMTVTESKPSELVRMRLDFVRPFKATNTAEFTFQPSGNQTNVTWSMFGKANLMSKLMNLFMSCDKMVGTQFANGLADIKAIVEGKTK